MTLHDLLSEHRINYLGLLKMDCEGAEYDILYHADPTILERIEAMTMEVHQGSGDKENIETLGRFLSQNGFACGWSSKRDFLCAARDPSWLVRRDLLA